jgi:hypothetical protein
MSEILTVDGALRQFTPRGEFEERGEPLRMSLR